MIEILQMTPAHIAMIAALEEMAFHDPWPESAIRSELENPLSYWLVAMDGDMLAGYVGSQSVMGEADMMNIAVTPAYRRKGVAEGLILRLLKDLAAQKVHSLTLEVRVSNLPAICLYRKLGFLEVGCRPNYYRNPKENALILRKEW